MDDTSFQVGDAVSFNVGSDIYATTVLSVSKTKITCADPHGYEDRPVVFTRRAYGHFVYRGRTFGTLQHGGETYRDNDR
jgi:hypothetical protein